MAKPQSLVLSSTAVDVLYITEFITLLEELKGAAPDWSWQHETTAAKDDAGFAVVKFKVELNARDEVQIHGT